MYLYICTRLKGNFFAQNEAREQGNYIKEIPRRRFPCFRLDKLSHECDIFQIAVESY